MSGGVDSSAAAMLLQQQGYDVTGATLRMFSNEDLGLEQDSACCSLSDVEDAKLVAHKLGIPHYVLDYESRFRGAVLDQNLPDISGDCGGDADVAGGDLAFVDGVAGVVGDKAVEALVAPAAALGPRVAH